MKGIMRDGYALCVTTQVRGKVAILGIMLKHIWMDWCTPAMYAAMSSGQEICWVNIKCLLTKTFDISELIH